MSLVRILRSDWERLVRARGGEGDGLAREVVERGLRRLADEPPEEFPPEGPSPERLAWLRRSVPRRAASVATLGHQLVTTRSRLTRAEDLEDRTYQRDLELKKDVVPALKEEARVLRRTIAELESRLRELGGNPEEVDPPVPERAIVVEGYERPQFETNEGRRKAAVEFFRRLEGYRR
jgi:hypothetical protein